MCGLVAVINKKSYGFTNKNIEMFQGLVHLDTLRGDDSTGIFLVENNGNVGMAKDTLDGWNFFKAKEADDLMRRAFRSGWAMVGHNRKATRGSITDKNAHPFVVDDRLVLVHNGSWFGDHKKVKDTEVDSEAIAQIIAEGPTYEDAFDKINAAYALMWYDADDKLLRITRNNQRPLFWMELDDAYVFSSERAFLNFAIEKYDLKVVRGPTGQPEKIISTFLNNGSKEMELATYSFREEAPAVVTPIVPINPPTVIPQLTLAAKDNGVTEVTVLPAPTRQLDHKQWAGRFTTQHPRLPNQDDIMGAMVDNYSDGGTKQTLYRDFMELKDEIKTGQKIKVEVCDVIPLTPDRHATEFLMVGESMDDQRNVVVFKMNGAYDDLVKVADNLPFYEVSVSATAWKRVGYVDDKMDNWQGLFVVIGSEASPVVLAPVCNC